MYEESVEARKTKQDATSAGSPALFMGTSEPKVSIFFGGNVEAINGVQMGPGVVFLF